MKLHVSGHKFTRIVHINYSPVELLFSMYSKTFTFIRVNEKIKKRLEKDITAKLTNQYF